VRMTGALLLVLMAERESKYGQGIRTEYGQQYIPCESKCEQSVTFLILGVHGAVWVRVSLRGEIEIGEIDRYGRDR
jgi:hypothetical protein